jgi:hypothetical protein
MKKTKQKGGVVREIIDMKEVLGECACPVNGGSGKKQQKGGTGLSCDIETIYECIAKQRLRHQQKIGQIESKNVKVAETKEENVNDNNAETALAILARNCADMDTLRSLCLNTYLTNEVKFCKTFTDAIGKIEDKDLIAKKAFKDVIDLVETYMTKLKPGYKFSDTIISDDYRIALPMYYITNATSETSLYFSRDSDSNRIEVSRGYKGSEYDVDVGLSFVDGKWKFEAPENTGQDYLEPGYDTLFEALQAKLESKTIPFFNKSSLDELLIENKINIEGDGLNKKLLRNTFNEVFRETKQAVNKVSRKKNDTVLYRESLQKGRIDAVKNLVEGLEGKNIDITYLLEPWTPICEIDFSTQYDLFNNTDNIRQLQIFFFTCLDLIHVLSSFSRKTICKVKNNLPCIFGGIVDSLGTNAPNPVAIHLDYTNNTLYFPSVDYIRIIEESIIDSKPLETKQKCKRSSTLVRPTPSKTECKKPWR